MYIEMDHLRIYEFVIFLLFQSFNISLINTTDLFTTIQYPEEKILNISCWNTSKVQIQNISVQEEDTPCRLNQCVLNVIDTQTIEDNCNGENSCLVDYNFTSTCLRELRYINLSYTCKYENRTSVSTFEEDYGDWMNVSSNSSTWRRTNLLRDHTMIGSPGSKGYSLTAMSYSGRADASRIDTDNEFIEPICLSLWYQIYRHSYDCSFNIYKISNGIQTLLFTAEGNSTSFSKWINISVDVHDQVPFKVTLEAHFMYRDSYVVRSILVDDTSIAHWSCQDNRTSVSTFEEDYGDWMNVSSNSYTWSRENLVRDHTMISSPGIRGYSMTAMSYSGRAITSRIDTDNEFTEPICFSLWYQLYNRCYDCSFNIYKISGGIQTLLFAADDNSTSFNRWINLSVDVHDKVPFKITLEAHFKSLSSAIARAILVDDTSIAHKSCKGQQITATCKDMNRPIKIECEKQFLSGDINLLLEPTHLTSKQKYCPEKSLESELNTFCRNVNKSDQCEFKMSDFMSGYKDCYVTRKTITVTYQCRDRTEGTEKTYDGSSFPYNIIGIVAGVFGGIVLTVIAVVVICRLKGLNGCECVTKNNAFPKRHRQESTITETGVYECSNISSRLSDHAYDSLECSNYYNMKNIINSSTSVHHENKGDLYTN